jgi:hypothetical protein
MCGRANGACGSAWVTVDERGQPRAATPCARRWLEDGADAVLQRSTPARSGARVELRWRGVLARCVRILGAGGARWMWVLEPDRTSAAPDARVGVACW